jgi:hypothetical protein
MTFEIPLDERFIHASETYAVAARMFEAASNVAVNPFDSEELFASSSLEIDGERVR